MEELKWREWSSTSELKNSKRWSILSRTGVHLRYVNDFAAGTPVGRAREHPPKSVAREMFETFQSFHDYIREYDLQRVEGLLLRYLVKSTKYSSRRCRSRAHGRSGRDDRIFREMLRGLIRVS